MQSYRLSEVEQLWGWQCFHQHVCWNVQGREVADGYDPSIHYVSDEMVVNVNVLCTCMVLVMLGDQYC